jgi:hypothetical protein
VFLQDYQKFQDNVFHKTPEGYYVGNLRVTSVGVYRYLGDDSKFVGRLRDVEEVKKATSSLNCKPVTLQHPNQPVTLDNVKELSVGMSANDATFDGLDNRITLTITDPKAIAAIDNGEVKAISCGYKCNVVDNAGVWRGSKHEQEQRDIVYNHIALVREGRAGDQVRFCVGDSADAEDIFDIVVEETAPAKEITEDENNHKQEKSTMKTIQLDGVQYEADEKVIEALQTAQDDAATKLKEIHTLLDSNSELEARVAELEDQLEKANDEVDEELIDAAVSAKIAILDVAHSAGIECDSSADVSELKRQVIAKAFDSIDLEAIEDEASINALFASASKVLADKYETKDGDEDKKPAVNPAAQFDGAPRSGEARRGVMMCGDAMEDALARKLYNISNGIKEA